VKVLSKVKILYSIVAFA